MLFLCGACQITSYYGDKCQASAWEQHKPTCDAIQTLSKDCGKSSTESKLTDAENGNVFSTCITPKEKGKVAKFIGKKCIVLCKLNGVEIPVLLDTGAQVSIISLQVLKHCSPETKLNRIEDCLDPGATLELTTANGTVLPYLGWVSINCELKGDNKGSGTISLPMLVTESILDHPIIGYHVLEQLISTCDTNSKTDEIIFALSGSLPNVRGENLCCLVESIRSGNDPYLCPLKVGKRNVIIPAGQTKKIMCRINAGFVD